MVARNEKKALGLRLRAARLLANISRAEKAGRLFNVPSATYRAAESGKRAIPARVLSLAAQHISVTADFLLGGPYRTETEKAAEELALLLGQLGNRAVVDDALIRRVVLARVACGFASASEAAKSFGWPISTYTAHENRRKKPSLDLLVIYALGYGVDPAVLFGISKFPAKVGISRKPGYPAGDEGGISVGLRPNLETQPPPASETARTTYSQSAQSAPFERPFGHWARSELRDRDYFIDLFEGTSSRLERSEGALVLPVTMLGRHVDRGKVIGLRLDGRIQLFVLAIDRTDPGVMAFDGKRVNWIHKIENVSQDPTVSLSTSSPGILGDRIGEIAIEE